MADRAEDDEPRPKHRIQRKRLGKINFIRDDGSYGFISAEDFREDVFFHSRDWEGQICKNGRMLAIAPEVMMWVEFELDDDHFEQEKKLRAKVVRPTDRPSGRKLAGRDATFKIVTHHPNARRKRPNWRK